MSKSETVTTSMILPRELLDEIKALAKRDLRSMSKEFIYLVRKGIGTENGK